MSSFNNLNKKIILPLIMLTILGVDICVSSGAGKRPPEPERIIKRVKIKLPQKWKRTPQIKKAETPQPVKKKPRGEKKPLLEPTKVKVASKRQQKVASAASKAVPEKKRPVAKIGKVDKPWAIHISSYISRPGAEKAARKFKLSGYNAYITEFDFKGVKWHRLRIGFYSSEGVAKRYAKNLSRTFNLKGVWVVRPSSNEMTSNIK